MKLKRIMALVLCFAMVLSTMSFSVFAEEAITVDSTETFQAALDEAIHGTTIQLQPGVAYGTVKIQPVEGNENTLMDSDYHSTHKYEYIREVKNLTIIGAEGATVDGIEIVTGTQQNSIWYYADIQNLTIDSVTFSENTIDYAVHSVDSPLFISLESARVDGLTVTNCSMDGGSNGQNFVYIYGSQASGSSFETYSKNVIITDNTVENVARLCELRGTENVTISGNDISNTSMHAILLACAGENVYSGDIVIKDNVADNIGERFVRMAGAGEANVTIEGNDVTNYTGSDSDFIKVSDCASEKTVTIADNTLEGEATTFEYADGIYQAGVDSNEDDDTPVEGGSGTEEDPYLINTVEDLVAFRDKVNAGDNYAGKYVNLNDDIDLSSVDNWTPIGDTVYNNKYAPADTSKAFSGVFDGNGKVISNLKIEKIIDEGPDGISNTGLFGIIGEGAVIKDLTITNVDIDTDGRNVGALAGVAYKATLENITVNGDIQISGGNNVSGVCAMTRHYDVSATDITVSGADGSSITGNNIVGGIFAEIAPNGSTQTFENLSVENVAINGVGGVGGIVGLLTDGSISNVSVKDVELVGKTEYQGDAMGRIRLGSIVGLLGSGANSSSTVSNIVAVENVTAKNLDGDDVVLPVVGANYGGSVGNATEARIGDKYYARLTGAIKAAKTGDTITLLCDIENVVEIPEGVTLDTNGYRFGPAPVEVYTYEELVAALKNDNANVIIMNDITGTATTGGYSLAGIVVQAGDVIDGNGNKLTINGANGTWDCAIAMTGGTVKNLTVAGAFRGIFMPGADGDVVIDNCKLDDVCYTFNSDAGSTNYTVTIKNTNLMGWTSYSNVHKSVTFENCNFGKGTGGYTYSYCRPYQPTTFAGCEFNEGFEFDTTATAAGTLEFNECTYADEEFNAETAAPLFAGGGTVVIDGETVEFGKYVPPVLSGKGTETDPYVINNLDDLKAFRDDVNAGNTYEGKYVALKADIDLTGEVWIPIGTSNYDKAPTASDVKMFAGNFDGGNHTITGLTSEGYVPASSETGSTEYSFGLFGYVYGSNISNVKLADVNINGGTRQDSDGNEVYGSGVAALIGYYFPMDDAVSVIENCHVLSGTVKASNNMGGLIGHMDSQISQPKVDITIKNCSNAADVTTEAREAGGILGLMNSAREGNYLVTMRGTITFKNCINTGDITSLGGGSPSAGGILGRDHNQAAGQRLKLIFDGCENSGTITVTANGETHAAGIAAGHYSAGAWLISKNSKNTGDVVVEGSSNKVYAGGLISYGGVVELIDSTSTGSVTGGTWDNKYVGGAQNILFLEGMYDCNDTVNGYTYYLNGGTSPEYDALVDDAAGGGNFHLVETAYKDGMEFGGWYDNASFTGEAYTALNSSVKTYYAKWIGPVAKIDNEEFETIQEAFAAAEDGDVIELLADITISDKLTVADNIEINGNNHTLKYTGTDRAIDVPDTANGANVTIKNLTIVAKKANRGINYNTNGTLTVENVTVTMGEDVDSYAINFPSLSDGATVAIKDSELTARIPVNVWGSDMTISISDSDITSVDTSDRYNYSAIQMNRDDYGNIADGTTVTITGGSITALNEKGESAVAVSDWTATGSVDISDTTTVIGEVKFAVATVAGVCFYDLQSAINGVVNNNYNAPITLIRDIELDKMVTVPNGANITLDLNGKTITGTDNTEKNFSLIDNRGDLTITGNGTMTLTATVNSGWGRYSAVIANNPGGKLTIENGTFEHLGGTDMAYGIDNLTNGKGTYAETIINGGTIKSTYRGIRQFLNGVEAQNILTINGGTIEGANRSIWMQDPSKNANTGTLTVGENASLIGDVYLFVTEGSTEWPVEVNIAAAALQDGSEVTTGNVPEKYVVKETNGTYGVFTAPVATLNGVEYTSLAEAIANVSEENYTITLIKDTNEVEEFVIDGKTVVIDLNENTFFGAIKEGTTGNITIKNGSIVNKNVEASGIEINGGKLTLENVNVDSARHAVRIDGAVEAVINGGKYTLNATSGTRHAVNVSGAANVTIKDGTFVGPKGTTMDSGSAVCVQSGATVAIEGGNFSGGKNATLGVSGTLTVTGGTYDQDVSAWCAFGYVCEDNGDGTYSVINTTPSAYTVTVKASKDKVRYNNNNTPDTFTVQYIVTGGNVIGAMAQYEYDNKLFTCKEDNDNDGVLIIYNNDLTTGATGETIIAELTFTVKTNVEVDTTYTFLADMVQVTSGFDTAGSGVQDGFVKNVIGDKVTVVAQYAVTLPTDNSLAGNTYVDKNTDYSATINNFDENMTYTIKYTMGDGAEQTIVVTKDNIVDGGFVIKNVTGDIVFTSVTYELNCEIVLVYDFVTGKTLVLVKDGVANGYTYNNAPMYSVARYVDIKELPATANSNIVGDITNATSVRAILIEGSVNEAQARTAIKAADSEPDVIEKSFDVNGNGDLFFSDAMTAHGCLKEQYELALELAYYLRADVDTDFKIRTLDYDATVGAIMDEHYKN